MTFRSTISASTLLYEGPCRPQPGNQVGHHLCRDNHHECDYRAELRAATSTPDAQFRMLLTARSRSEPLFKLRRYSPACWRSGHPPLNPEHDLIRIGSDVWECESRRQIRSWVAKSITNRRRSNSGSTHKLTVDNNQNVQPQDRQVRGSPKRQSHGGRLPPLWRLTRGRVDWRPGSG